MIIKEIENNNKAHVYSWGCVVRAKCNRRLRRSSNRCSAPRSVSSALPVFLQFSSNCLSQKKFRRSLSLLGTGAEEGGGGDISIAFSISHILHTTNYPSNVFTSLTACSIKAKCCLIKQIHCSFAKLRSCWLIIYLFAHLAAKSEVSMKQVSLGERLLLLCLLFDLKTQDRHLMRSGHSYTTHTLIYICNNTDVKI